MRRVEVNGRKFDNSIIKSTNLSISVVLFSYVVANSKTGCSDVDIFLHRSPACLRPSLGTG